MLNGGPAVFYLSKIRNRYDSLLAFVGFQVEDTPGKIVLETGIYRNEEQEFEVNCRIRKFDFSSHAGKDELIEIIKRVNPKKVICVHGDKCKEFAKEIEEELGIESLAPKEGDEIRI
jgi:putative mRNA 3-end processing factor